MEGTSDIVNQDGEGSGDSFVDRSRVRILLCDNDDKSSEEIFYLLLKCSYQVTCVRSPRQVIDALNAEGHEIDIILAEVDLPMKKGLKLLKYISHDTNLRRIPVIMMSAKDEVPVVVKCLRLGAADYLVKPLRTNELLNLWTHMWRRRRMLGLAEKNLLHYELDLAASDPSDDNTNSTNLFSDDTEEKSRRSTILELGMQINQENEVCNTKKTSNVVSHDQCLHSGVEMSSSPVAEDHRSVRGEELQSVPRKSELKIGESSAFFTYVKSNMGRKPSGEDVHEEGKPCDEESVPPDRSNQHDGPGMAIQNVYPFYMNQVMMPQVYHDMHGNGHGHPHAVLPQFPHLPSHGGGMASFPYYPLNICLQSGSNQAWGGASPNDGKLSKLDRREAALMKFRQKRKERCFDKKIRYVNRKKLAERRPRIRGQFVRKMNGVYVDLNGQPNSTEDEEEEEYDDPVSRDSSPENEA